ncbi:exonuclease domain-containing protein [Nonomuraea sp. NPDC001023]|uniref:exonuclease domain-containing protein n=1 Tax=unclassified Nonomuraea TaxID=2593643 RepID=UPI0033207035
MSASQIGYAAIDVETTGLRPSWHDRIIEIGIVHTDPTGRVTGEWNTLVNPERDLGPQHIHGISASDIRHAPTFKEIAGTVLSLLRHRVPVAHNLRFDAEFLQYEFARIGTPIPSLLDFGVCTMTEARRFLPHAPRNLAGCCAVADISLDCHHDALIDARAASELLHHYLALSRPAYPWPTVLHSTNTTIPWPVLDETRKDCVRRGISAERQSHFLARILDRVPQTAQPMTAEPYLALLDRVLLDHHISATEADALVELATSLGLSRVELEALHRDYLAEIARAALADGIVTNAERRELELVASLLGLPDTAVEQALNVATVPVATVRRFELHPGDPVVFTGEMDDGREVWEGRARQAGYLPHPNVTKKVRLVVAADPDSLSGKARKARAYGIPIVTPHAFARMLG